MEKRIVIVRARDAGVHAGTLESQKGDVVRLRDAIRLWRWVPRRCSGQLASLSEVAVYGIDRHDPRARTGARVSAITVIGACEVIEVAPEVAGDFAAD